MEIAQARGLWQPEPGWLNTASFGLPPRPAWDALQAVLADWRVGRTSWEGWDEPTGRARESFARLVGVPARDVAVGAQVSQLLGPIAAALPDGARVVAPEIEFTSNLFPWLTQADRGVRVTTVPADRVADAIGPGTDLVAFSVVHSVNGQLSAYRDIVAAARTHGALVVADATQAAGWLPFDASLADAVVVSAYKWLMSPRGSAFAYLSPELQARVRPTAAGWYAAEDVFGAYYGPPLRLAKSARKFDISPAWFSWVGTAPALDVIERIGIEAIHAYDVALANRFLAGLGRPPGESAIVTVEVPGAEEKLAAAGIKAAVRGGWVRASFHLYNTEHDVDRAVEALVG